MEFVPTLHGLVVQASTAQTDLEALTTKQERTNRWCPSQCCWRGLMRLVPERRQTIDRSLQARTSRPVDKCNGAPASVAVPVPCVHKTGASFPYWLAAIRQACSLVRKFCCLQEDPALHHVQVPRLWDGLGVSIAPRFALVLQWGITYAGWLCGYCWSETVGDEP